MATMTVLVTGQANADFPAIVEAARVYPAARRLQCDRIRIEKADGARVAEFTLDTVARFLAQYRLTPQPERRATLGVDYEPLRRIWGGGVAPSSAL